MEMREVGELQDRPKAFIPSEHLGARGGKMKENNE